MIRLVRRIDGMRVFGMWLPKDEADTLKSIVAAFNATDEGSAWLEDSIPGARYDWRPQA